MDTVLIFLFLALQLLLPISAHAQSVMKTPLSYSLTEYGVVLGTALLGGAANWYIKAKKDPKGFSIAALIGELCVSAFAGVIAFWLCESFGVQPLLTAAAVGMAGHAGARGLDWLESTMRKTAERRLGLPKE
jgi:hypothetical protein